MKELSRRDFLKLSGKVGGLIAVAAIAGPENFYNASEELLKEIEGTHDIEIRTLRQVYRETGREYPEHSPHFQHIPDSWDEGQLLMIKSFLPVFPPHFYQRNQTGRKLQIVLSNRNRSHAFEFAGLHQVDVNYETFHPGNLPRSFEDLGHELIHEITPQIIIETPNPVFPGLMIKRIDSPWIQEIERILGGSFSQIVEERRWEAVDHFKTTSDPQLRYFYSRVIYGFSDPLEFIAVLGERRLPGEEYFKKMFGNLFTKAQVDGLHNFVSTSIFQGQAPVAHIDRNLLYL